MSESFLNGRVTLHCGDSRDVLRTLEDCSIDSIVTDPPYALVSITKRFRNDFSHLEVKDTKDLETIKAAQYKRLSGGFMGQKWDSGETAHAIDFWQECLRILKPGGHVVAFSGTRTYHRMACAIEDAGFEIRDTIQWLYGSGFPKSHDVSKGIDRAAGAEREILGVDESRLARLPQHDRYQDTPSGWQSRGRDINITAPATDAAAQWEGWGTALKPANEPICLARKPLSEKTIAANVLKWGTGAINIDGTRIEYEDTANSATNPLYRVQNGYRTEVGSDANGANISIKPNGGNITANPKCRWPANVVHDGSDEVVGMFPETTSGTLTAEHRRNGGYSNNRDKDIFGKGSERGCAENASTYQSDSGSAARFFYTAKADSHDRIGSKHPTVKPVDLMQWLCRLITPPNGRILDPFAGTGTTGEAAFREGFNAVLIERETEYQEDIRRRMALCLSGPDERQRESIKAKMKDKPIDNGPLFGGTELQRGGADRFTDTSQIRTNDWPDRIEEMT